MYQSVDDAAELTDFAGLVLKAIPPVRPFAEARKNAGPMGQ